MKQETPLSDQKNPRPLGRGEVKENIPVGTYVMTARPDGPLRFTFVSDRWLRMLDLPREAVLADPSLALTRLHPSELAGFTPRSGCRGCVGRSGGPHPESGGAGPCRRSRSHGRASGRGV